MRPLPASTKRTKPFSTRLSETLWPAWNIRQRPLAIASSAMRWNRSPPEASSATVAASRHAGVLRARGAGPVGVDWHAPSAMPRSVMHSPIFIPCILGPCSVDELADSGRIGRGVDADDAPDDGILPHEAAAPEQFGQATVDGVVAVVAEDEVALRRHR